MGASWNKALKPEELAVFRSTENIPANLEIPERPENRKPTNQIFLLLFFLAVILLIPGLIYTLMYSDIDRLSRFVTYDQCGNNCGMKNAKHDKWSCTGKDFTKKKYLQFEDIIANSSQTEILLTPRQCVSSCDQDYQLVLEFYCFHSSDPAAIDRRVIDENLIAYLKSVGWRIFVASFMSLPLTLSAMVLLRKTSTSSSLLWIIFAIYFVIGVIVIAICWYGFSRLEDLKDDAVNADDADDMDDAKAIILILNIALSTIVIVQVVVLFCDYKEFKLALMLFKEAMKAAFAMPQLIFIPILTDIAQAIVLILCGITTIYMVTAGKLTEVLDGYLAYRFDFVMVLTIIFNIIIVFWTYLFINGIQHMIIGGAVSKWYFAPNKERLDSPIKTSARVTFKFHLGSIALGSLVIVTVTIIIILMRALTRRRNRAVDATQVESSVFFCGYSIKTLMEFVFDKAYILIAMHGKPFFKSGVRSVKIIYHNMLKIITINLIGGFILCMLFSIALASVLAMHVIMLGAADPSYSWYSWVAYVIVFFVSLSISCLLFAGFEIIIYTIFLCYCEDCLMNDGAARPYAMSSDLKEFVENSKIVFKESEDDEV